MKTLVEGKLSYRLTGLCYKIHNEHGRFLTEKQYTDLLENNLKEEGVAYIREKTVQTGELIIGRPDFIIEGRLIIDLKAKKFITQG